MAFQAFVCFGKGLGLCFCDGHPVKSKEAVCSYYEIRQNIQLRLATRGQYTPWAGCHPVLVRGRFHLRRYFTKSVGLPVPLFIHSFVHSFRKYLLKVSVAPTLCAKTEAWKGASLSWSWLSWQRQRTMISGVKGRWGNVPCAVRAFSKWRLLMRVVKECAPKKESLRLFSPPKAWVLGLTRVAAACLTRNASRIYLDLAGFIYKTRVGA